MPSINAVKATIDLPSTAVITDMLAMTPSRPRHSIDLVFFDPPFNAGKKYGEPGQVNDRLSDANYWTSLRLWLGALLPLIKPGGSIVVHHRPRSAYRIAGYLERVLNLQPLGRLAGHVRLAAGWFPIPSLRLSGSRGGRLSRRATSGCRM